MKTDLRIIKSKEAIERSFIELMKINEFTEIKIIDISKKARVNRNTVYLHYESKEGLAESVLLSSFSIAPKSFNFIKYMRARNNKRKVEEMYKNIFDIIDKNVDLYKMFLNDDKLQDILNNKIKSLKKLLLENLKPSFKNEVGISFILSGNYTNLYNYIMHAPAERESYIKFLTDFTILNLKKLVF